MFTKNRRESSRVTVHMLAGETCGGQFFLPMLSNLSDTGLLIECPSSLEMPRKASAFVELTLPGVKTIIKARCQLVRETCHGFFRRRAMRFVDIAAVDRLHIQNYLQRACGRA